MDQDRLNHSYRVGMKMIEIGQEKKLTEDKLSELFILGYNHDIGYDFLDGIHEHNEIGGLILKENNYKYWKEVYLHGDPLHCLDSMYLLILNQADMQIDKYGDDVGYDARLKDIESRYGSKSKVYEKAKLLIEKIKDK